LDDAEQRAPALLPWMLSGQSEEGLRAQAACLRDFLADAPEHDAIDVGLSLAGRAALEDRAVLLGGTRDELLAALAALAGGGHTERVLGTVDGQLAGLAEAWVRGEDVDWAAVFDGSGAQRIVLPSYAFQRARYWLATEQAIGSRPQARALPTGSLAASLAGMPPGERERIVLELVRAQAAEVLRHDTTKAVRPGRSFRDLGFDSLAAVQLRNRLAAATGLALPVTLAFDQPNAADLAGYLAAQVTGQTPAPAAPASAELDQLQAALSAVTVGRDGHQDITRRLRAILAAWEQAAEPEPGEYDGNGITDKLHAASAAEVLAFIDRELMP
jgi:acyl transferase domain-containing protein